jgi:hypothetical protein
MAYEVNGKVGPGYATDGSLVDPRMTKDLATCMQQLHGKYYEATYRGNVFTCSTAAAPTTMANANASPLAAGTGQPIIGLLNPQASGKNLIIMKVNIGVAASTVVTGNIVWNYAINQTITAAANGTINCNFLGGAAASIAKAYVNTATTGSTAGIMLRPAFQLQFGSSVGEMVGILELDMDGDIIVPPGGYIALANGTANASTTYQASITWEEALI